MTDVLMNKNRIAKILKRVAEHLPLAHRQVEAVLAGLVLKKAALVSFEVDLRLLKDHPLWRDP